MEFLPHSPFVSHSRSQHLSLSPRRPQLQIYLHPPSSLSLSSPLIPTSTSLRYDYSSHSFRLDTSNQHSSPTEYSNRNRLAATTITMGSVGRFICVSTPFALTLASLICLLICTLSGLTNNNLSLFTFVPKDMSIPVADLSSLTKRSIATGMGHEALSAAGVASGIGDAITSGGDSLTGTNITASDLGLYDSYTVSLWNYCYTSGTTTTCLPGKFDWASNASTLTNNLTSLAAAHGVNFTSSTIRNAVKSFGVIVKWTEVVYIAALVLAALELVVGLFAFCSRIGSCVTFIVSGFFTTAAVAAAGMSTFLATLAVGTGKSLSKYGVQANYNMTYLILSWVAVAFAVAAGLFWLFSMCCCAPDHSSRSRSNKGMKYGDKVPYQANGYQRVNDPFIPKGMESAGYAPPMAYPQAAQRYEPYSHHAV
jgi:hypothetical protein